MPIGQGHSSPAQARSIQGRSALVTGDPTPLARRVRERLAAVGLNATQAAREMGHSVSITFVRDILWGRKRSVRGENLIRLAEVLQTSPRWLEIGETAEGVASQASGLSLVRARDVVIRGEVQAGVWSEAWDWTETLEAAELEAVIVAPPAGYERANLFALRVRGRSMDRFYLDGDVLIVCPASEADPRVGDHVIVLRRRSGLAEATVKELISLDGGYALLAHSSDPAFAAPILLFDDGDDSPEIIGVVVGSYRTRPRPPPSVPVKRKDKR